MTSALLDPDGGYYTTAEVFGRGGDFITAPEISQCFGEMLGLWAVCAWQAMGMPQRVILAEVGPGRGTLMMDALRAAAVVPAFVTAAEVWLVEASPRLRRVQEDTLKSHTVHWAEQVEDLPSGPLILLGNEFIDALPIRQFIHHNGGWHLRRVGEQDGALCFAVGETVTLDRPGHDGLIVEDCPAAQTFTTALCHRPDPLAALLVDYGYCDGQGGDSLQAVKDHAYAPVFSPAGTVDLTAHVDFSALAATAAANGATVWGVVPQGMFLDRMGIKARAALLLQRADFHQRQALVSGVDRLLADDQMGRLFKVIGFGTGTSTGTPPIMAELFRP